LNATPIFAIDRKVQAVARDRNDAAVLMGKAFMEIEAIQANNADPIPLRASQQRIGTLVLRFIGLLFLSITALALVWIR
jgi:hypothetical protein